jgi:hypothetical protein
MPDDQPALDTDISARLVEGAGPASESMLRVAAAHGACMMISDAAHSLRRSLMIYEAATAAALVRSIQTGDGGRAKAELALAEESIGMSIRVFKAVAVEAVLAAGLERPTAP